jgi:hypothetical protein
LQHTTVCASDVAESKQEEEEEESYYYYDESPFQNRSVLYFVSMESDLNPSFCWNDGLLDKYKEEHEEFPLPVFHIHLQH